MIVCLTGCNGSQPPVTPPITQPTSVLFANTPPTSLSVGGTIQLSAAVGNTTASLYVTWSVSCGTANACGSFSFVTTSSVGSTVYTAPSAVPSGGTVTITATSVADPTKSVSVTITITTAPTTPISVTFYGTPPPASTQAGASISVSAKVTNDPSAEPLVDWTASCSLSNCGTFSLNPSASEASTTYAAPTNPASSTIVTIRATSVTDPSESVSAVISIQLPIAVAFYSPLPSSLPTGASASLSAVVINDISANPEANWSATCGGAACGSFTPTSTANKVSTTYTAPSTAPADGSVTVTATSVADPSKSVSANIPIVARVANPSLPDGKYVYQVSGQNGTRAGVFVAAGGAIVGGEQDSDTTSSYLDPNTGDTDYSLFNELDPINGGIYTTSADGNLQVTLQIASVGAESFEVTPAPHGYGFIAGKFSSGESVTGTLNLQTSAGAPSGGYVVSLQGGFDIFEALVGVLNFDTANGISGTGSELEACCYSNATYAPLTVSPGTVSTPDQYGRVLIELNASASSAGNPIYLAGYMIDATHIQLIETAEGTTDNSTPQLIDAALIGVALGQGAATGKFTTDSLAGSSYVFVGNSPLVAGVFTAQSGGSLSGTLTANDGDGSTPAPQLFTGSYTVDSMGQVSITTCRHLISTTIYSSI